MDEKTIFGTRLHRLINGLVDQQAMPDDWWQDEAAWIYDQSDAMESRLNNAIAIAGRFNHADLMSDDDWAELRMALRPETMETCDE